jgi:ABC-type sugar transport system substrate-binding protein
MKKFIVPLVTVAVVASIIFAGCVPGAAPTPPAPAAPTVAGPAAPPAKGMLAGNPLEGLAVKPDGTPYTFAYEYIFLYNPYMAFAEGVWADYMSKAGAKSIEIDANLDETAEISGLTDLLTTKPDAVLVHPVDGWAAAPAVDKLTAAGIPVFNYCVECVTESIVSYVEANHYEMGKTIGKWTADYFAAKGEPGYVFECQGLIKTFIAMGRHDGFMAAIDGTNVHMEPGPDCAWADEECCNNVISAFPAHPEYNCVYTHGGMLDGATSGLRTVGLLYPVGDPNHIVAVSIDANDATCRLIHDGWADAVVSHDPWPEVDYITKAMFTNVILGQPVPYKDLVLPSPIYTYQDIVTDWGRDMPIIWGVIMDKQIDYNTLPVLDMSDYIQTPTAAMRKELVGY